eukprot:m.175147 g.175147  ORF g.175147 m.175147 type:complete len:615 (+) comp18348_c0_seq13:173-2017(+)
MAIALHHKVQMQDTLQYPRVEMAPTPYQEISLGKKFMLSKTLYYAALKKSFKMPDRFLTLSQINSSTVSSDTLNSVPVVMSTETGTQTEAIGFTAMELGNLKTTPQQNEESMAGSSQSTELFPNVTAAFPVPPPDHKAIADIPGSVAATENSQYTSHATSSDWQLGEWIATDQDTETTWGDLGNPTEESVCSLASSMVPLMSQSAHSSTPSADGVATELPIGCASIGNATVGCKAEYGANESQSARNGNSAAKRKRRAHPNTTEKPLATKKSRTTGARANLGALPLAPTTETNLSKPRKGSVAGAAQELQKLGKGPCELCKRFIQDRINDYIIYFPHPGTSLRSKSHFTDHTLVFYKKDRYSLDKRKKTETFCQFCRPDGSLGTSQQRFLALWGDATVVQRALSKWNKTTLRFDCELASKRTTLAALLDTNDAERMIPELATLLADIERISELRIPGNSKRRKTQSGSDERIKHHYSVAVQSAVKNVKEALDVLETVTVHASEKTLNISSEVSAIPLFVLVRAISVRSDKSSCAHVHRRFGALVRLILYYILVLRSSSKGRGRCKLDCSEFPAWSVVADCSISSYCSMWHPLSAVHFSFFLRNVRLNHGNCLNS